MRQEYKDLLEQLSFGFNMENAEDVDAFKKVFINTYGGSEDLFNSFINDDSHFDNKMQNVVKMNLFKSGGHRSGINKSEMLQVIEEKERRDFLNNYGKTVAQCILRDAALHGV